MLQIVAMTFVNLPIDGLLDPYKLVHQFITMLFEKSESESVLSIDDPYEQESICLESVEW